MKCIYEDYPERIVFVMSDIDEYYKKLGYKREGSIFEVTKEFNEEKEYFEIVFSIIAKFEIKELHE